MSGTPALIPEPIDATSDHEVGYSYGKAAFQNGKTCEIWLDDFVTFMRVNKIIPTSIMRQAWAHGWDNAQKAVTDFAKLAPQPVKAYELNQVQRPIRDG